MNQTGIRIDGDLTGFPPGAVIEGAINWEVDYRPKTAMLRLFWYTEGKGTQDIGIVQEKSLNPASRYQERFRFQLPEAPYSFSGQLISLKWAIELVLDKGKDSSRVEFIVSPWTEEPKLKKVEDKDQPVFRVGRR